MRDWLLPTLLSATFIIGTAQAYEPVGFSHSNQHLLMQVHGLPELGRAVAPEAGGLGWGLDVDWTSEYTTDTSGTAGAPGSESIVLDAESVRVALRGAVNLSGWLLEANIPYVTHTGGGLDGFIDDWHDFTGLPGGGRDQAPRDRLLVRYERDGQAVIDLQQATGGIGDIQLGLARPVGRTVVRLAVKLPTGDADKLTGSGGAGGSMTVDFRGPSGTWWGTFGGVGALVMADGDLLPSQQRRWAGVGSLGLALRLHERLDAKVEVYGHTPLYQDSALGQVARGALVITTGGALRLSETTTLDFAVAENPVAKSSPDVSFHFALRHAI
ncbi:DUF3187 family protein [uncultured Abyssibacter sp.]|uniref:DUF3187 family protein n=1 Tax=uncultured Abyssibacter sp. TaxID=2320202 RepID=UPI0032B24F99